MRTVTATKVPEDLLKSRAWLNLVNGRTKIHRKREGETTMKEKREGQERERKKLRR